MSLVSTATRPTNTNLETPLRYKLWQPWAHFNRGPWPVARRVRTLARWLMRPSQGEWMALGDTMLRREMPHWEKFLAWTATPSNLERLNLYHIDLPPDCMAEAHHLRRRLTQVSGILESMASWEDFWRQGLPRQVEDNTHLIEQATNLIHNFIYWEERGQRLLRAYRAWEDENVRDRL